MNNMVYKPWRFKTKMLLPSFVTAFLLSALTIAISVSITSDAGETWAQSVQWTTIGVLLFGSVYIGYQHGMKESAEIHQGWMYPVNVEANCAAIALVLLACIWTITTAIGHLLTPLRTALADVGLLIVVHAVGYLYAHASGWRILGNKIVKATQAKKQSSWPTRSDMIRDQDDCSCFDGACSCHANLSKVS